MTDRPTHAVRRAFQRRGASSTPVTALDGDLLLPRPPGLFRRFWSRHALLADVLIAFVGLLLGYAQSIYPRLPLTRGADWLVHGWFLLPVVAAAAIVLRRRQPLLSLGTVLAASFALTVVDGADLTVPILLAVYAAGVYSGTLAAWLGAAVAWGGTGFAALASSHSPFASTPLLVALLFAVLIGTNIGARRRYLDALIERAEQLARERDQQAQLATAAERARIAREMHDIVAHSLSVMVRLSDGANAVAASDPARAHDAVAQIGEVGRDALRDMRRLLGVLRDEDADLSETIGALTPQPTLADLPHLIETYRSAGLPVAVQVTGTPPGADAVQLIVFRAVQEGLTNSLRYASEPSRVLVQLDFTHGVTVVVSDDGFQRGPQPSVGSGRGLLGLRERAALYGGNAEAGPLASDGRGWRVIMTLPQATEGDR